MTDKHNDNTFLKFEPESDFWRHVRYDTPEETWDEFENSLNKQGFKARIIWEQTPERHSFEGIKFETAGDKLKFIFKYSS
jgi:hypothetical protein